VVEVTFSADELRVAAVLADHLAASLARAQVLLAPGLAVRAGPLEPTFVFHGVPSGRRRAIASRFVRVV